MAEENHQNAHMEAVAGQAHVAAGKHLAGTGFPCVLAVIEAHQTADQKYGDGKVGVKTEQDGIQILGEVIHGALQPQGGWNP